MARLNSGIISLAQTLDINSSKRLQTSGVDLNFKGHDALSEKEEPFELSGHSANINRALFWLSSKKGDFGRRNLHRGGVLYEMLGKLSSDSNLKEWEASLTSEFNNEFSQDLELLDVQLYADPTYKKLIVNMVVRDVLTNKLITISEGAEL